VAWADLGYEEIARALGVPVETVRSRPSRARHRVRRELAGSRAWPPETQRGGEEVRWTISRRFDGRSREGSMDDLANAAIPAAPIILRVPRGPRTMNVGVALTR
jgi:hypothetical protein